MTVLPARKRVGLGLTRTYQTSRLFLGLSVEDNLYLSVVGKRRGASAARSCFAPATARCEPRPARSPERVGLEPAGCPTSVKDLSHGEQRQLEVGMALAGEPRLMMLDEPAAGLSRTERAEAHGDADRLSTARSRCS